MNREIEKLYIEHSDIVYRYIFLLTKNKETAEDLTQDTFYKAFKNLHKFRKQSSEKTWLLKIARHTTYDYFRRKRIIHFSKWENDEVADEVSLSPEFSLLQTEQFTEIYKLFDGLKKDYKDVLILRKVNELSIKETAYILGWTEAKVKTKTARALEFLKKEYSRKEGIVNESFK